MSTEELAKPDEGPSKEDLIPSATAPLGDTSASEDTPAATEAWAGAGRWAAVIPWLYVSFAIFCAGSASSAFYGYLKLQTHGSWSAPLDDVFIHFDYARSFARGYPFQWSEGNGYSSGNTSLSYPIVLAVGYWMGLRSLNLMWWAAVIAVASLIGLMLSARGAMLAFPATPIGESGSDSNDDGWTTFLLPPFLVGVGALNWTMFSGMENAWHLLLWGLCASAWAHEYQRKDGQQHPWRLGVLGMLLVSARPESAICVFWFGVALAWRRRSTRKTAIRTLIAVGTPSVMLLAAHAAANKWFTSEWSANGSIAKLFTNNPYLTWQDKLERYQDLLSYVVVRVFTYHISSVSGFWLIILAFALMALAARRFRPLAIVMWLQTLSWVGIIALNNQARWHNERYVMPAVAWMLILAAIGLGELLRRGKKAGVYRRVWPARLALAAVATTMMVYAQIPRWLDQQWFFGRASRNILDQHVTAGRILKELKPNRVLVGDAGALTYVSDRRGLDLIGLGGYHDLPFARATVHGMGAALELIERMPKRDRPDFMALYPSWWGDLPAYFGRKIVAVPVHGNVICGGAEKIIYRARWAPMERESRPRRLKPGEQIVDEVDFADLVSERAHGFNLPIPQQGHIDYRLLRDPNAPKRPLFDAGRVVNANIAATVALNGKIGDYLVLRFAQKHKARLVLKRGDGAGQVGIDLPPIEDGMWVEVPIPIDGVNLAGTGPLTLTPEWGTVVLYHLWVVSKD